MMIRRNPLIDAFMLLQLASAALDPLIKQAYPHLFTGPTIMLFRGLDPGINTKIESGRLTWIAYDSFMISAAYYAIKQFLSISSAANSPNPVPDSVLSPLMLSCNGGK
jgi:hypothetical protein